MKYSMRKAAVDHQVQVLEENRGIQRLALQLAAQEEGAGAPQDRADDRQIEVGAGGDVRHHQAAVENDVGQQQVIDMAAVAGYVDDAVAGRHRGDAVEVVHLDAVIDLVPDPGQEQREGPDHGIGVVRGDFKGEIPRRFLRGRQRDPARFRIEGNRRAHTEGVLSRACNWVRRCDRSGPIAISRWRWKCTRRMRPSLRSARRSSMSSLSSSRREIGALKRTTVWRPWNQHRQQVPQGAHLLPGFGKQGFQYRILIARFAAPENGHRHQLHVEARIAYRGPDQRLEQRRVVAARIRHQASAFVARKEKEGSRRTKGGVAQ
jgi:hypothetical protein